MTMTKGELRRARKSARAAGERLPEFDDRDGTPVEFSESRRGRNAIHRWARRYDSLNGAPESESDR